jgi:hypothetical protein
MIYIVSEISKEWFYSRLCYLVDLGQFELGHLFGHLLVNLVSRLFFVVQGSEESDSLYRSVYKPYNLNLSVPLELYPALCFGASSQHAWAYTHELPGPLLCPCT